MAGGLLDAASVASLVTALVATVALPAWLLRVVLARRVSFAGLDRALMALVLGAGLTSCCLLLGSSMLAAQSAAIQTVDVLVWTGAAEALRPLLTAGIFCAVVVVARPMLPTASVASADARAAGPAGLLAAMSLAVAFVATGIFVEGFLMTVAQTSVVEAVDPALMQASAGPLALGIAIVSAGAGALLGGASVAMSLAAGLRPLLSGALPISAPAPAGPPAI